MNIGQVYSTEIVGFVIIGILLFKFKMPKAGLLSIALAIVYPLASDYFGEVKHWISFLGCKLWGFNVYIIISQNCVYCFYYLNSSDNNVFPERVQDWGHLARRLPGAIGFTFYGLYKWEQNLIDIFSNPQS